MVKTIKNSDTKKQGINHAALLSSGRLLVSTPLRVMCIDYDKSGNMVWDCNNNHIGSERNPTDDKKRREQKFLLVDKRNPNQCFFATTNLGDLQFFDMKKGQTP